MEEKEIIRQLYPNEPYSTFIPLLEDLRKRNIPEHLHEGLARKYYEKVMETRLSISFQTCLYQVLINRIEEALDNKSVYKHRTKQFAKGLVEELSKFNGHYFSAITTNEQADSALELINLIADKIDEAWEQYRKEVTASV